MTTYTPITLNDLTTAAVDGTGVFDVLMRATKGHLDQEFKSGRIKGNEFATVYLGSLQSVLQIALQFVLQREAQNLDAQVKAKEIDLASERIALAKQEVAVAIAKLANIPKEGALLDAQVVKLGKDVELAVQQIAVAEKEVLIKEQQVLVSQAEVGIAQAKLVNIPKEGAVLDGQACKLRGEYDKIVAETGMVVDLRQKTAAETNLLDQKRATEAKQTDVMDKQALLLTAQAGAFTKDYEVKMQDLRVKAWATARTTDPDSVPMMNF